MTTVTHHRVANEVAKIVLLVINDDFLEFLLGRLEWASHCIRKPDASKDTGF
jgi:hypothetical protein